MLFQLPLGARIGTSSLRRKMQLLRWNSNLIVEEVRGNVDTRVRKVEEGHYDAVVLALAGMNRLGLSNYVAEIFPPERFYPSPGQGIIAVECCEKDPETEEVVRTLNHEPTRKQLDCERAFLRRLEGGCQLPCGIATELENHKIKAAGAIFATEGLDWAEAECEGPADQSAKIGEQLAELILEKGGQQIMEKIRHENEKKKQD
jgi:hydroxymethylbilane synthase